MEKKGKKESKDVLKENESNQRAKATEHTDSGGRRKNKNKKDKAKGAKGEKQKLGVEKKSSELSGVECEEHDLDTVGDSSRKMKRKDNENETMGSSGNNKLYNETDAGSNKKRGRSIDGKEDRAHDEPEKEKSLEISNDVPDKKVNKKKDKKREAAEINGGEGDLTFLKQENVDGDNQLAQCNESGVEKQDRKKKKKEKNQEADDNRNNPSSVQATAVSVDNVLGDKECSEAECVENGPDEVHNNEGVKVNKKKKKKPQEKDENGVEKHDRKKKKKKNQENDDNGNNPSSVQDAAGNAKNVRGDKGCREGERAETGPDEVHSNEGEEVNKKKKKKSQEEDENGVEKQDRKKKKKKKNEENDDNRNNPSSVQDPAVSADNVRDDKECSEAERAENGSDEVHNNNKGVGVNKKKKKKSQEEDENCVEKQDRKKKRKKNQENDDNLSSVHEAAVNANTVRGDEERSEAKRTENGADEVHNSEGVEANKKKKKKSKVLEDVNSTPNKSNKKVRFSDQDEVFPVPVESEGGEVENLVRGKRFTLEEDSIVEKAVYDYIEEHGLGEEGLEMVLNPSKHGKKVKGCWKEIAKAIPYRPYTAVYYRGQILFRRSENRSWTQEEYDLVLKHQELNGNQWKELADELGKHYWHVKDAYRRIKLPNRQKGHWSQKEYQNLFDLVNADLQLKISEEKKSKHGMLRDNICWTGISDRMETRAMAPCCMKWYRQLTSPMVTEGIWADADDYRLIGALYSLDENCMEDVDWDNLVEGRSGEVCRKRWNQMRKHIGYHGKETFSGQVEVLAQRYCPHLVEAREAWDSKLIVDRKPVVS